LIADRNKVFLLLPKDISNDLPLIDQRSNKMINFCLFDRNPNQTLFNQGCCFQLTKNMASVYTTVSTEKKPFIQKQLSTIQGLPEHTFPQVRHCQFICKQNFELKT